MESDSRKAGGSDLEVSRPNLLFIMVDQMRRHAAYPVKEDPVLTPNLDRLGMESIAFSNAVTTAPLCVPARASLFTGKQPTSTGVYGNSSTFNKNEFCLGHALNTAGYSTGYIGKWHLDGEGIKIDVDPHNRGGFGYWYGYNCQHDHYLNHDGDTDGNHIKVKGWQVDHETDAALKFLEANKGSESPFALVVSYSLPHPTVGPSIPQHYSAPKKYEDLYKHLERTPRANFVKGRPHSDNIIGTDRSNIPGYYGAITSIDDNVGRLLKFLDREKLSDDSIVVFTSDHGDLIGSHAFWGKRFWHEESTGIPLLIRWPSKIAPRVEDVVINIVDIMPTLLSLMGIEGPKGMDGRDLSGVMLDESSDRPEDTYLIYSGEGHCEWRCVRSVRYSYCVVHDRRTDELKRLLYDLKEDYYQLHPITEDNDPEGLLQVYEQRFMYYMDKHDDERFRAILNRFAQRK